MTAKTIYLDNATAARPSGEAVSHMLPFYSDKWGSPLQPHQMGQDTVPAIKEAVEQIGALLGASPEDVIEFTLSGGEALHHLLFSAFESYALKRGKNHFISSTLEDPVTLSILKKLEHFGASVTLLKPDDRGIIRKEALAAAITPRTAFAVFSWANGLTGVVQPMEELAAVCQERSVKIVALATHVLGKWLIDVSKLPIDFLIFHGEPLHAPQGAGCLWARKDSRLYQAPEKGHLNVPACVALGIAAKQTLEAHDYLCTEIARLKWHFEKELVSRIPQTVVLFGDEERVPHITALSFAGLCNEALLFFLNRKGVYATIGGGVHQPLDPFLTSIGIDPLKARGALSFSLSRETTEEEIERAIALICTGVTRLSRQGEQWRKTE